MNITPEFAEAVKTAGQAIGAGLCILQEKE